MNTTFKTGLMAISALMVLAACATEPAPDVVPSAPEAPPPSPPPPPAPPPPPPPPAMAEPSPGVADEIVVTGSRMSESAAGTSVPVIAPPMPGPVPPDKQVEVQAGTLTAGDYDDVLNPDLYKAYLDKVLQGELSGRDLPYVDANNRIAIKVVDRLGKPVPLAKVSLKTASGDPMFPLRTGADGMAYVYPAYDALGEGVSVTVTANGQRSLTQTVSPDQIASGGALTFDLSKDVKPVQQLDLLLTLDATGSMTDEMRYLQAELVAILNRVNDANPNLDIRAGFIVYRDKGDAFVVRESAFTDDLEAFKTDLSAQAADGGGDFPEAMQDAMKAGLGFDWRDEAIKINLLVADAPPHDQDIAATWDSALVSRSRGIHIVPVGASGVETTAEFLMRGMAQLTGGRYIFLTDDSGVGNAHAEPTVDCYAVTRLDGLVFRVLQSLISGTRVEPDGDEVIRTVGNYRAGVCKIDEPQEVAAQ